MPFYLDDNDYVLSIVTTVMIWFYTEVTIHLNVIYTAYVSVCNPTTLNLWTRSLLTGGNLEQDQAIMAC